MEKLSDIFSVQIISSIPTNSMSVLLSEFSKEGCILRKCVSSFITVFFSIDNCNSFITSQRNIRRSVDIVDVDFLHVLVKLFDNEGAFRNKLSWEDFSEVKLTVAISPSFIEILINDIMHVGYLHHGRIDIYPPVSRWISNKNTF